MKVFNYGNDYAFADSLRKDVGERIEAVTRHEAIEAVKEAAATEDAEDPVLEGAEGDLGEEAQEAEEDLSEEPEPKAEEHQEKTWAQGKKNRRKGKR